jgi:hypothetical protein
MSFDTAPILACNVGALDPATRTAHFAWIRHELASLVRAADELPNGMALELPVEALAAVAVFIDRERRCCPFLRFELDVAPAGGPLRLRLTGPAGVAELLRAEFNLSSERSL